MHVLLPQHGISRGISGSKIANGFSQNLYSTLKIFGVGSVQIFMKIHDGLRAGWGRTPLSYGFNVRHVTEHLTVNTCRHTPRDISLTNLLCNRLQGHWIYRTALHSFNLHCLNIKIRLRFRQPKCTWKSLLPIGFNSVPCQLHFDSSTAENEVSCSQTLLSSSLKN
jgi:hypothetical protein